MIEGLLIGVALVAYMMLYHITQKLHILHKEIMSNQTYIRDLEEKIEALQREI